MARPERLITGMVIKISLVILAAYLFYIAAVAVGKSAAGSREPKDALRRAIESFQRNFRIGSVYVSEEDVRDKARRYLK